MAKQKNNIIMRSTRGMIGGQIVFKRRAGKGYVAAAPEVNEGRQPTESQLRVRERFGKSVRFASLAIKSPELKLAYENAASRGQTAFNKAFQDASYGPEIVSLITSGYVGTIGNTIVVTAQDDFRVNAVRVTILNANGELIEEGAASAQEDGFTWTYRTTVANGDVSGCKVIATAYDIPENQAVKEETLQR